MAIKIHIDNLKSLNSNEWRKWRKNAESQHFDETIDDIIVFREYLNSGLDLKGINITGEFEDFDFSDSSFRQAIFKDCVFKNCYFMNCDFTGSKFRDCRFSKSNMGHSILRETSYNNCFHFETYFGHSNLAESYFSRGEVTDCEFHNTIFYRTNFHEVRGLEQNKFRGRSSYDMQSCNWEEIPLSFIRGCGVPEFVIDYFRNPEQKGIEFFSCFISYSSKDEIFANKLYSDLQNRGIRCWFAPENLKIGDKIRTRIDESIKIYDKLLLILSANSIDSGWVEHEVETAFEKEIKTKNVHLFPISLDESVFNTNESWAAKIKRERHIGNFKNWNDEEAYSKNLDKLIIDLSPQSE